MKLIDLNKSANEEKIVDFYVEGLLLGKIDFKDVKEKYLKKVEEKYYKKLYNEVMEDSQY